MTNTVNLEKIAIISVADYSRGIVETTYGTKSGRIGGASYE